MNRLPLSLSIVAVVIALSALVLAIIGIQGLPNSLSVERQVLHYEVYANGQWPQPYDIHLNAGDVLQGYARGGHTDVDYSVSITGNGQLFKLGSGHGGTSFCFVAEATGTYKLQVGVVNHSSFIESHTLPFFEDVPVVYWIQEGTEQ